MEPKSKALSLLGIRLDEIYLKEAVAIFDKSVPPKGFPIIFELNVASFV